MESKPQNKGSTKNSSTKDEKFDPFNNSNMIFFNSVTGERMTSNDGNESDMYEVVPDMEQYAQDNITQYTDICEKDKQFFKMWNSFIKSEENSLLKFKDILIKFLNLHSKALCENDLKKNFILHLVAIYDNRQIDDDNLVNIIDYMDKQFKIYDKSN